MFQTEVDVGRKKSQKQSTLIASENLKLEDRLDMVHEEQPTLLAQFENEADVEFKQVLKSLVKKTQLDALQMEKQILSRLSSERLSRGWKRATGAKMAPLKILAA